VVRSCKIRVLVCIQATEFHPLAEHGGYVRVGRFEKF
jgi:hypothetical protein